MGTLLQFACIVTIVAAAILAALRASEIAVGKLLEAFRRRRGPSVR